VGASAENVAIFQGVRGSVLGFPLQKVAEPTDIALTDLPEAARSNVRVGILSDGLAGARATVARLRDGMLPPCPAPGLPAPSAELVTPVPSAPVASPVPPSDSAVAGTPPGSDTTPLPTVAPEPNVNCRVVR
jgi:protein phosphatase